jgi:hypothetical protein
VLRDPEMDNIYTSPEKVIQAKTLRLSEHPLPNI